MAGPNVVVSCTDRSEGWICDVVVAFGGPESRYVVTVSRAELARYAPPSTDPADLVEEAFWFLLEHEGQSSILPRFAISDIEKYFPAFGDWARR